MIHISLHRAFDFRPPIIDVRLWISSSSWAVMSMPETPVDEYGALSTNPRDIWIPWNIFAVEAVTHMPYLAQQRSNK